MGNSLNKSVNINYGVALLKMLMCFEVVICHFGGESTTAVLTPFYMMRDLAVPFFMFLSFYLTKKTFLTVDNSKTKKRIWRVIYPQIGWAIIYWLVFMILQIKINLGISFHDLLWQILTGHSPKINPSMWFQTVLIILTIIYILTFRLLKERHGLILISVMTIFSLWFQYSGQNLSLFGNLRYELKYPLGRIAEMVPYASIGFFVAYFNVYDRLKKYRTLYLVLFGLISLLLFRFNNLIPSSPGFNYSHNNNLLHVFFIAGFAYLLPFERIPQKAKDIIQYITRYTLGIYCVHRLIGYFFRKALAVTELDVNGFTLCVFIYIAAFCMLLIMHRLSPKYLKPLAE